MSLTLSRILQHETQNVAELLDDGELAAIAARAYDEYALDEATRTEWLRANAEALEIAEQEVKPKSFPWPGASNVKFPLIATASMQFAARAYPSIVQVGEVVKTKIVGRDPDGAKKARGARVAAHMNYQLCEQMTEWEEDMDSLLHRLPVVGSYFKATYFDPIKQRPTSELISPVDLVINQNYKRMQDVRRATHLFTLHKNQILERQRSAIWLDKDLRLSPNAQDEQGPFTCLAQHRWLDLDGDGYEEPYIVVMVNEAGVNEDGSHQIQAGSVVRIIPRYFLEDIKLNSRNKVVNITPQEVFTKLSFVPNFSGKFLDIGFGRLLLPVSSSIDTLINQLIDSGTINNLQGGFISKQLRLKGGRVTLEPGEWKQVDALTQDLRGAVVPLPTKEPSLVLFQMLGLLMETGKQLSSVSEVLSGEQSGVNVPATTTLALIEQGLKVFSAINKRIHRSLKHEFGILYQLNSHYLDDQEYFRVLDEEQVVARQDYAMGDFDVYPVADPASSTEIQSLIKAEALVKTIGMPGSGDPYLIMHEYYGAIIKDKDKLEQIHPSQRQEQPPPPEQQDIMAKIKEREAKLPHEIEKLQSEAALNYAKANSEGGSGEMEAMAARMDMMMEQQKMAHEIQKSQLELQAKKEELELKRHEAALDMEITRGEHELKREGLVLDAQAQQEQAQLEREQMEFQREEADKDRAHTSAEATKDRAHGGLEADKDRESSVKLAKMKPKPGGSNK